MQKLEFHWFKHSIHMSQDIHSLHTQHSPVLYGQNKSNLKDVPDMNNLNFIF